MKLQTKVCEGRLLVDDVYIDHQNIECYQAEQVSRDALAAHALLRAMEESQAYWGAGDIRKRADEIIKEWTGEVG